MGRCHRKRADNILVHAPEQLLHYHLLLYVPVARRCHSVHRLRPQRISVSVTYIINTNIRSDDHLKPMRADDRTSNPSNHLPPKQFQKVVFLRIINATIMPTLFAIHLSFQIFSFIFGVRYNIKHANYYLLHVLMIYCLD